MLDIIPVLCFETSKGSTYWVDKEGITQRYKVLHVGHDPNDTGYNKPSERTLYLDQEYADFILSQKFPSWVMLVDEKLYIMKINEEGKPTPASEEIPYYTTPECGRSPYEWRNIEVKEYGTIPLSHHMGNPIVRFKAIDEFEEEQKDIQFAKDLEQAYKENAEEDQRLAEEFMGVPVVEKLRTFLIRFLGLEVDPDIQKNPEFQKLCQEVIKELELMKEEKEELPW